MVESQQIPIFMINGAVGGTRIDQHQRNALVPSDLSTIYGRTLWRIQQAKLTHGIRAVLWHQGENDQGADGPTGDFWLGDVPSILCRDVRGLEAGLSQHSELLRFSDLAKLMRQDTLLNGTNGMAALTFCDVAIRNRSR